MTRPKKKPGKRRPSPRPAVRQEVSAADLNAIVERVRGVLSDDDHQKLAGAVGTLATLTRELETKGASIRRLRKMLFGSSTEKLRDLFDDEPEPDASAPPCDDGPSSAGGPTPPSTAGAPAADNSAPKTKPPGHGRNGADSYTGAKKVRTAHPSLKSGDPCPTCKEGKVYPQADPAVLVRVTGMAPLSATVIELERLRCGLCGKVCTAPAPDGVGTEKYDETAAAMIGLLKYGAGMPFTRLEKLETSLGIPLPKGTQWEVVAKAADTLELAYDELVLQAAQGELLHNDDTTMKILDIEAPLPWEKDAPDPAESLPTSSDDPAIDPDRTGVFTTGIVSTRDGHRIALFLTGRKHAGENLADVLAQRAAELSVPIQMCDALSRNTVPDVGTLLANCNAHARRNFVEVAPSFPEQVQHVLEQLATVYHNDALAREKALSPEQRLHFHQEHSGAVMDSLRRWLKDQLEKRRVEPNSGLGEAIRYMLKHWDPLTLFLRQAGAPLDNNVCERALKKAILHRKNALFYKTRNGARVGDIFMSLIHTAELCGANTFAYLVALLRHPEQLSDAPEQWMPWNYHVALARTILDAMTLS